MLERLKGLDPKTFGLLSGMINQGAHEQGFQNKGASLLQAPQSVDNSEAPEVVQAKLEKLAPIINHLKMVNPKMFGALAAVTSSVQQAPIAVQPSSHDIKVAALQTLNDRIKDLYSAHHAHDVEHAHDAKGRAEKGKQEVAVGAGTEMSSSTESWISQRFGDIEMLGKVGQKIVEDGARGDH